MTTALSLQDPGQNRGKELDQAGSAAKERAEIESAIIVARKFPRNVSQCFQELTIACGRYGFADDATYEFPRGTKEDGSKNIVSGPSVNLAREAGRIWGNIRYGLYIMREDDETMTIRGWAWDVQTNTKVEHDDNFKKLIQRKVKGSKTGETEWLEADERDLRELVNRRGAILVRNSLLQVMPKDLIEGALKICGETLAKEASTNMEGIRKRLLVDFGALNIMVPQIEEKLGHPIEQSTAAELTELRGVCNSIRDGNSTWAEYVKGPEGKPAEQSAEAKANEAALAKGQEALAKQQQAETQNKAEERPVTITCDLTCDRLGAAQSVAEIAKVMNDWEQVQSSTPAERKKVIDSKDAAMQRLNPRKKK